MKHFEDAAARAVWALRAAQLSLDMELFIKAKADETSLLFADADELKQFVRWAEDAGMEHFKRVESDRMVRVDRNATEGFDVRFEFLRWPDQPWRIEAMCVLDGQAPLHEAHLETHGSAKPVHVSFKCDTLPAYNNMKRTMADDGVEQIPFHAEYRNSYGLFSYWGVGNFYLKPRVNLRIRSNPCLPIHQRGAPSTVRSALPTAQEYIDMDGPSMLVVGAQPLSLGWHVTRAARNEGWSVTTAGISGEENIPRFDITKPLHRHNVLKNGLRFDAIVCTAGINIDGGMLGSMHTWDYDLERMLTVNAAGPLALLRQWVDAMTSQGVAMYGRSFVAVSSNSAHVARSQSAGYCASKAALSMGLRCAARELADTGLNVWGVEPGWLKDTPMSKQVTDRLSPDVAPHRIPGDRTIRPEWLAEFIINNINPVSRSPLNGCMMRIDGGEQ